MHAVMAVAASQHDTTIPLNKLHPVFTKINPPMMLAPKVVAIISERIKSSRIERPKNSKSMRPIGVSGAGKSKYQMDTRLMNYTTEKVKKPKRGLTVENKPY